MDPDKTSPTSWHSADLPVSAPLLFLLWLSSPYFCTPSALVAPSRLHAGYLRQLVLKASTRPMYARVALHIIDHLPGFSSLAAVHTVLQADLKPSCPDQTSMLTVSFITKRKEWVETVGPLRKRLHPCLLSAPQKFYHHSRLLGLLDLFHCFLCVVRRVLLTLTLYSRASQHPIPRASQLTLTHASPIEQGQLLWSAKSACMIASARSASR